MKLKQAGAIKEVFYPEWLGNTMVIKKQNEKWRICIDFNALNQLRLEHSDHHPLISRPCVFQTKRHHLVIVVSNRSDKSCLFLII